MESSFIYKFDEKGNHVPLNEDVTFPVNGDLIRCCGPTATPNRSFPVPLLLTEGMGNSCGMSRQACTPPSTCQQTERKWTVMGSSCSPAGHFDFRRADALADDAVSTETPDGETSIMDRTRFT
ncbi:hypothetical protein Bbelb_282020 [Branchiostoma belcheri]|nr:hypothetical protein Bbelb_282020 [Branchiostoma belcheri]